MKVLLTGTGGREHALAWKIAKSPILEKLWIAGGNAGMGNLGEIIGLDVTDHSAVIAFCQSNEVGLIVVGPEAPLVAGLADDLEAAGFPVFGPSKAAAQLEGSKSFTKALCDRMNIPTSAYGHFKNEADALAYVNEQGAPIVIKADGLAAGKGVTVAMDLDTALNAVKDCFDGTFGEAGAEVVIEEFMEGEEASFFFLCDGKKALALDTAQDHKRVGDGDTGPNTGGMGAYSPAPCMTQALIERTKKEIIEPTMRGMAEQGMPFKGVLYAGLMLTNEGPKLVEYNVRFGDPECQVLMMRMQNDLLPILAAAAQGDVSGQSAEWDENFAMTVVMAAKGYPASYAKGTEIKNIPNENENGIVFHAGTKLDGDKVLANGGRVLNVSAKAPSVQEARDRAYAMVEKVDWEDGFYRSDIGHRAL